MSDRSVKETNVLKITQNGVDDLFLFNISVVLNTSTAHSRDITQFVNLFSHKQNIYAHIHVRMTVLKYLG